MNAPTTTNTELQTIEFNGDQIVTAMVNGVPHVAMRPIVENLEMSWSSQLQKINSQKGKYSCVDINTTGADGKRYQMLAMPNNRLTLWLASINPNKIKDKAKREKIELYQEECGEALYNYWHKGVAVRGDMEGVVTDLDPKIMQAIGGMMKGIVNKGITEHLTELIPSLVEKTLADGYLGVVSGVTAHDTSVMAGIGTSKADRKGLRGLGNFISKKLDRYHKERGIPVKMRDSYGPVSILVFDKPTVRDWLAQGGRRAIHEYVSEKRGQTSLKLVK